MNDIANHEIPVEPETRNGFLRHPAYGDHDVVMSSTAKPCEETYLQVSVYKKFEEILLIS